MRNSVKTKATLIAALLTLSVCTNQSQARRMFARGPAGVAGGYAYSGANGERAGGRLLGANAGVGASAGSWAGPNGGAFNRASAGGYKRGVGAFRKGGFNATGANGGTAAGSISNKYNAQTGMGTRTSSVDATSAAGKQYGYNADTNYTKGQGLDSTIDTKNKGDYTVDYSKGAKPVVTQTEQ